MPTKKNLLGSRQGPSVNPFLQSTRGEADPDSPIDVPTVRRTWKIAQEADAALEAHVYAEYERTGKKLERGSLVSYALMVTFPRKGTGGKS